METPLTQSQQFQDTTQIIAYLGDFGRFQQSLTACFVVMMFSFTFQGLYEYFSTLNPNWKCTFNSTVCLYNDTFPNTNKERFEMAREDWEFTEPKGYSLFTEFDIYCDDEWLVHLSTAIIFVGSAIGAIILGWVADNYGRKTVLFPSSVMMFLLGFISAFAPNIYVLIVCHFIKGFFNAGTVIQMFVLLSEFVSTARRPLAVTLMWFAGSMGLCAVGLIAYFIREWKMLLISLTVPGVLIIPLFWFVPESARWLHVHGKDDEVKKVINSIAYWNKKELPADFTISPLNRESVNAKASYLELFRSRRMAIESAAQGYTWMVNGMVYYGLSLAANDLGGSLYLNFVLGSLAEFPANFITIILCNHVGRKKSTIATMALGGISCIIVAFISTTGSIGVFRIALGIFGRFCITISFNVIYTWSVEIYPTRIRAEGMGYLRVTSRIGAASSPFIARSMKFLHPVAPFILMGSLSLIASLCCVVLPETKDRPMQDVNERKLTTTEDTVNCAIMLEPQVGHAEDC